MLLQVADVLRCPAPHEDSALVLSVDSWSGRHVVEGTLGCPVCRAVYPIRDGVADLRRPATATEPPGAPPALGTAGESEVLRLAAQLDLREPGGLVLLGGRFAQVADRLMQLVDVHVVALNGAPLPGDASVLRVDQRLPFASSSLRAAAVDVDTSTATLLDGVVSALRPHGRLVAPVPTPLPGGVNEIARDDRDWVAEKRDVATSPTQLRRRLL